METPISIQSLSDMALELSEARSDAIKKYRAYKEAEERQRTLQLQLQIDLELYSKENKEK